MPDTKIGNAKAAHLIAAAAPAASEESLIERENALAAREERLLASERRMLEMMARMERMAKGTTDAALDEEDAPKILLDKDGKEIPRFDRHQPHGTVIGDEDAGYVQNGHRFDKAGVYLCEEPRGTGKPFNLKLLGVVLVPKAA